MSTERMKVAEEAEDRRPDMSVLEPAGFTPEVIDVLTEHYLDITETIVLDHRLYAMSRTEPYDEAIARALAFAIGDRLRAKCEKGECQANRATQIVHEVQFVDRIHPEAPNTVQ